MQKEFEPIRAVRHDGKVYIDFDQMLQIMYDVVKEASRVVEEIQDPTGAFMVQGMLTLSEGMERVLRVTESLDTLPQV